jgi:hypothetical protein
MSPFDHHTRLKNLLRRTIPLCLITGLISTISCSPSPLNFENTHSAPLIQTPQLAPTLQVDALTSSIVAANPNGALVADDQAGGWAWLDTHGRLMEKMVIPSGMAGDPSSVHVSARVTGADRFPAIIAHAWLPQPGIVSFSEGQVSVLHTADHFLAMAGAPGQPLIAFSEIAYQNGEGDARLYAGHITDLNQAVPLADLPADMPGFAPLSLAVDSVQGVADNVWYSLAAWDSRGADMLFPLSLGLFKVNLISGESQTLLGLDRNVQGLSPDRSMAASMAAGFDEDQSLQVHYLASSHVIGFDLKPGHSSAGFAVFSPLCQRVAWLEAGGTVLSESDTILMTVRVAQLSGEEIVAELDLEVAARAAELAPAVRMRPVGWLDEDQLLIEVNSPARQQSALVRMDVSAGSISLFSPGRFLTFTYP